MIEVALRTALPGFTLDVAWQAGDEVVTLSAPRAREEPHAPVPGRATRPDAGRVVVNGRVFDDTARRHPPAAPGPPPRLRVPGLRPVPPSDRGGERGVRARSRPGPERQRRTAEVLAQWPSGSWPSGIRRALGRPAAAGGPRPRHRAGPGGAAPRRAALRPRCAAPPAAPRGAARAGRRAPADRRARHPRSRRGLPARRSPDPLRGRAGRAGGAEGRGAGPPGLARRWRGSSGSATSCAAPWSRPRRIASRSPGAGTRSRQSTRRPRLPGAAPGAGGVRRAARARAAIRKDRPAPDPAIT